MPDKHQLLTKKSCVDFPNNCIGAITSFAADLGRVYREITSPLAAELDDRLAHFFSETNEHVISEQDLPRLKDAAERPSFLRELALGGRGHEFIPTLASLQYPLLGRAYRSACFDRFEAELGHRVSSFQLIHVIDPIASGLGRVAYAKYVSIESEAVAEAQIFASCIAYSSIGYIVPLPTLERGHLRALSIIQNFTYYPLSPELRDPKTWESVATEVDDDLKDAEAQMARGANFNALLLADSATLLTYLRAIISEYRLTRPGTD